MSFSLDPPIIVGQIAMQALQEVWESIFKAACKAFLGPLAAKSIFFLVHFILYFEQLWQEPLPICLQKLFYMNLDGFKTIIKIYCPYEAMFRNLGLAYSSR